MAVIAATVGARDPFVRPLEARAEADAARRALAGASRSDHWLYAAAAAAWERARGDREEHAFLRGNFLSGPALATIARTARQLEALAGDRLPGHDRHAGNAPLV